jgi:hypothetical protein
MSKGSKRRSWRRIEGDYRAVAPPALPREPLMTCALPPRLVSRRDIRQAEREAEKERLRDIARETLAAERKP